jgi:hypothetical protein
VGELRCIGERGGRDRRVPGGEPETDAETGDLGHGNALAVHQGGEESATAVDDLVVLPPSLPNDTAVGVAQDVPEHPIMPCVEISDVDIASS